MVPRQRRPLQNWKIFLRNHGEEISSIDLFIVPTIAFRQLFVLLVLGRRRRQLLWFAVTQNPTAEWLARQIAEAFPWDTAPKYLIRDNDRAFGGTFKARSGKTRPEHARSSGSETLLRIRSLAGYIIGTLESRFRKRQPTTYRRYSRDPA
jgi:hypothetical protein